MEAKIQDITRRWRELRAVTAAPPLFSLADKNALVTGGGRGLRLEIARMLVAKGAHVTVVARDDAELGRAVADLEAHRAHDDLSVPGLVCDLRAGPAIDALLRDVRSKLEPIDVLVNNAGIIQVGPLAWLTLSDFGDAMKLRRFAPVRTMLDFQTDMRERGGGRIANISSIGGVVAVLRIPADLITRSAGIRSPIPLIRSPGRSAATVWVGGQAAV